MRRFVAFLSGKCYSNTINLYIGGISVIYTVTLNPAVDYVVALDAFAAGTVNRAQSEAIVFGGKGINVSLMLKALNTGSTALGFIAGFTGEAIRAGIEAQGVRCDFVTLESGFSRINVKLHAGEETEINGMGPEIPQEKQQLFFEKLNALTAADTLVLSGSAPRGLPQDLYARIAQCAAERGARLVVDASGALLTSTLPYRPFLIKPNREELSALFHVPADTDEAVLALVKRLQAQGAQHVLVSMAGDGALLCTAEGAVYRAPAAKGTVVNSVGAGDSMVGGFLAGWEKTGDFAEALALGTAAGGATAFSVGIAGFQKVMAMYDAVNAGIERIG